MVVMNVGEKESLAYLSRRQVFPTPTLNKETSRLQSEIVFQFMRHTAVGTKLTAITDHKQLDLHVESIISSCHFDN